METAFSDSIEAEIIWHVNSLPTALLHTENHVWLHTLICEGCLMTYNLAVALNSPTAICKWAVEPVCPGLDRDEMLGWLVPGSTSWERRIEQMGTVTQDFHEFA